MRRRRYATLRYPGAAYMHCRESGSTTLVHVHICAPGWLVSAIRHLRNLYDSPTSTKRPQIRRVLSRRRTITMCVFFRCD